jgi:hypothetical protein
MEADYEIQIRACRPFSSSATWHTVAFMDYTEGQVSIDTAVGSIKPVFIGGTIEKRIDHNQRHALSRDIGETS